LPHILAEIPFRNPIQIIGGGRDGYTSKSISAQRRISH
jgi:hypothetical protein